jgi:hypothetical protein
VRPVDAAKVALLVGGIVLWLLGYSRDSQVLMISAVVVVVAAFLLRFVKTPPAAPGAPRP